MQNNAPLAGHLLQDTKFRKIFKNHLRESEGVKERFHFDDNDVLSVGVGIALGDKSGLYSREIINRRLAWTGADLQISEEQHRILKDATSEESTIKRNEALKKNPHYPE